MCVCVWGTRRTDLEYNKLKGPVSVLSTHGQYKFTKDA